MSLGRLFRSSDGESQRVVVGARSSSSTDKQRNGEVRIFEFSEASDSWVQIGSSIHGQEENDRIGFSVSISGDGERVALGAPLGNRGTGSWDFLWEVQRPWILGFKVVRSRRRRPKQFSRSAAGNNSKETGNFLWEFRRPWVISFKFVRTRRRR